MEPTASPLNRGVLNRPSDIALVEFRSAVDAVGCGVEIRNVMVEHNAGVQASPRVDFRIGVHLAEVGEGDGGLIPTRLGGIAEPGASCLSEDPYWECAP